eukprot:360649-Chlamydomonas_euryale.AAC.1
MLAPATAASLGSRSGGLGAAGGGAVATKTHAASLRERAKLLARRQRGPAGALVPGGSGGVGRKPQR